MTTACIYWRSRFSYFITNICTHAYVHAMPSYRQIFAELQCTLCDKQFKLQIYISFICSKQSLIWLFLFTRKFGQRTHYFRNLETKNTKRLTVTLIKRHLDGWVSTSRPAIGLNLEAPFQLKGLGRVWTLWLEVETTSQSPL